MRSLKKPKPLNAMRARNMAILHNSKSTFSEIVADMTPTDSPWFDPNRSNLENIVLYGIRGEWKYNQ